MFIPDSRVLSTGLSILIRKGTWTQIWCQKFLDQVNKQIFSILKVLKVRHPGGKTSGFRTVQKLKICQTSEPDVMSDRALMNTQTEKRENNK